MRFADKHEKGVFSLDKEHTQGAKRENRQKEVLKIEDKTRYLQSNDGYKYFDTMITVFPERIELKQYPKNVLRKKIDSNADDYWTDNRKKRTRRKKHEGISRSDSTHRSFTTLSNRIEYNAKDLHSFVTLTFSENITDLDEAHAKFKSYIKSVKRKNKDFKYIGVIEFQKRGAIHYHIYTTLKPDSELIPKREIKITKNINTGKYFNLEYYDLPHWSYGYSTAFDVVRNTDENFNLASYMAKYFYAQADERLFGRKKILSSRGWAEPDKYRLLSDTTDDKVKDFLLKGTEQTKIKGVVSKNKYAPDMIISNFKPKQLGAD